MSGVEAQIGSAGAPGDRLAAKLFCGRALWRGLQVVAIRYHRCTLQIMAS
jgi:hypothetical protein